MILTITINATTNCSRNNSVGRSKSLILISNKIIIRLPVLYISKRGPFSNTSEREGVLNCLGILATFK